MQRQGKPPDMTLEITPQLSHLVIIRKIINAISESLGFSPEDRLQLEMATDEACSNSIFAIREKEGEHSSATIRIDFYFEEHCLRLMIVDKGKDFTEKFNKAQPFHDRTDRTRKRGYGLQIIKTFMDEVDYFHEPDEGNKLILTKYFTSL